ncbi:MAG: PAS domain S-box protein [Isosphaeraceae bacterium]
MLGSNSLHRRGYAIAFWGAVPALAVGCALTSSLGPHVLYASCFLAVLFVARYSGGAPAFCVLILGSLAALLGSLAISSATTVDQASKAWAVSLYYGAGVASILFFDSRRRSPPYPWPVRADRPHREPESTRANELIPSRILFEQSRDGIHILDTTGKLRGCNRQFEEMLGYSHQETKKLHVWDWDAAHPKEQILEGLRRCDPEGAIIETRFRRKDGSVIDVEINANQVEWRGRSLICCVARDVSRRKWAEEALRESEERFRVLVENAADSFLLVDEKGALVDVNSRACDSLGYSREELLRMHLRDVQDDFDEALFNDSLSKASEGQVLTLNRRARRKDGTCYPVEIRLSRCTLGNRQLFLGLVHDITVRQARQRELERTNRLYATLSAVNQAVERMKSRDELFQEICRITVERSGFKLVWIGLRDPDTQAVVPVASAGDHQRYVDGIKVYADDRPEGRGPIGICIREDKPSVFHDFMNDPRAICWRKGAIAHGLHSAAAFPIHFNGEVIGAFIVYSGERDAFQDREVGLLQEVAATISFAMDHLDQEEKRQRAEHSLREREAQYRAVIETSADGFLMTDDEGCILEVNEAYVRRSGYSREELVGKRISDIEAKEDPQEFAAHIFQIRQGGSALFESLHRAKDGTIWPVEVNAAFWPSAGGRILTFLRDVLRRNLSETLLHSRFQLSDLASRSGLGEVMRSALDAAELFTGSHCGYFHFVDRDQENLSLQAWSTNTMRTMDRAEGEGKQCPISKAGVWVDCWHYRAPVIHNDYATPPHGEGLPEAHVPLVRALAVPVLRDGAVVAILSVGNRASDYTSDDLLVVQELASMAMEIVARKQAEERLHLQSAALEACANAIVITNQDAVIEWANPAFSTLTGYSMHEAVGRIPRDLVRSGVQSQQYYEVLWQTIKSGQVWHGELVNRRKDGALYHEDMTITPVPDENGTIRHFVAVKQDVTERQARERELERTNRLYATLSAVNQAVERMKSRDELFQEICRITVERSGFKLVWIGWHDPQTHAIVPIASTSDETGYLVGLKLYADDRPEGRGPVGVCIRTGQPLVVHNLAADPGVKLWMERTIAHGLSAAAALPLRLGGEIWGVFVVYAAEGDVFQEREIGLLGEIADSISFALDHLEQEEKRRQAEESVRQREAQYRAVIETSTDGFWMADAEGRILEVNDAIVRQSGYSRDELLGMRFSDLEARETPEDTAARVLEIRNKGADLFESRLRAKDGTIRPIEASAAYWPASGGRILAFQRDISARKHAEEVLRQRIDLQDQLAKIAEAVPGAIFTFYMRPDGSSHMTYASPAFEDLAGLPWAIIADDLAPCFANVHPDDLPRVMESIVTSMRSASAWHAEFRYLHPTRGERWMEGWSAPRIEPDGRVLSHGYLTDVTERKRVEEALGDSEAVLQAIVKTAVDAIITIDPGGKVLSFNPSAERVFGFAPEEVIGRDVSMLMPVPHSQEHGNYVARYMETGVGHVIGIGREISAQRKDGTVFPMEIGVSEIRLGDKVIFVGILRDITQRKAAEEEIRKLNTSLELMVARRTAELESMLANATIGLAFFDRQLRFVRANRTLAEYTGAPVETFLGRTLRDLSPPSADRVEPILQEVFETGKAVAGLEHEVRRFTPPHEVRQVLESYFPVADAQGEVICAGTAVVDITDRKRAEEELAELNRSLRQQIAERERVEQQARLLAAVLEESPDFVGIADPAGRILYLNRAFREGLGRSPEGERLTIPDCHPQEALRVIEQEGLPTAARLGVWRGETEFVIRDGRSIPMSQVILSHSNAPGGPGYYSTIMRDISERKQLEEALRRHGAELSVANAELARAARLKDEFLASMSHELRTPLNGILGISEGLQELVYGPLNPDQQAALHDIEECGRHLLSLINDILDVAKIEAGKIEVEPGPVAVAQLCQASLRLVRESAQKKKLALSLHVDESVGLLVSDERRLKQVLVNLLSNAVKFTPERGEVGLEVVGDRARRSVCFTVRDSGIGIHPEDLPRLFQPFVQLDSRLSREYQGSGLGLALVKRLTILLGGSTLVDSQPGLGSRFTIVLPWIEESAIDEAESTLGDGTDGSLDAAEDGSGAKPLVLVVEDNPTSAKGLSEYLCFKGFRVEWASNAIDGIALAGRLQPSLVVMDIQMPGVNGLEAIRRIRLLPTIREVPIIALTALAMPGDRERCLKEGATEYVTKPIVLKDFFRLIVSLLYRTVGTEKGAMVRP